MRSGARLGILGGTLDPVHVGHIETALAAREALGLDRVLLLPSLVPPHRAQQPATSPFHRFAMAALAVNGVEGLEASDTELLVPGPSYTADTLNRLHGAGLAPSQIFFIIGADAFAEIETWSRFPLVLDLANFVVLSRPGYDSRLVTQRIPGVAARVCAPDIVRSTAAENTRIFIVPASTPDVSSTDVRRRLRSGAPVAGLIPEQVEQHIRQHGLYIGPGSSTLFPSAADHLHGQN